MNIKLYMYALGIIALLWNLLFVTRIFLMAYLNPSNRYAMNINSYGEATVEIILILILLPFGLYVVYDKMKEIYNGVGTLNE